MSLRFKVFDRKDSGLPGILRVKMRRSVILVVHGNHYPEKSTDFWHLLILFLVVRIFKSRPTSSRPDKAHNLQVFIRHIGLIANYGFPTSMGYKRMVGIIWVVLQGCQRPRYGIVMQQELPAETAHAMELSSWISRSMSVLLFVSVKESRRQFLRAG